LILIDSNVIYNFLFETELTDKAEEILNLQEQFSVSFTVWNEVVYAISRKIAEQRFDIKSYRNSGNSFPAKAMIFVRKNSKF